jgi:hypothetical protein
MTKPDQNPRKTFDQMVKEQFEAFERREFQMRMEERKERAAQLKLPLASDPEGQLLKRVQSPCH